jgi:hypothetical protein
MRGQNIHQNIRHIKMEPPCREADKARVECPECERPVQIRWLRYGHVCGRTFNVQQRAVEGISRAEQQFRERVAPNAVDPQRAPNAVDPQRAPNAVDPQRAPNAAPAKDWSLFLANAF